MTTARKTDRLAAEKGPGQGGSSNAGGTASRKDNQGQPAGAASPKAASGRPGHKTGA